MVKDIYLALFVISLVLSPVYVFAPGLPQPADFLSFFLILVLATGYIVRPPLHKDLYLVAALFVGHIFIVNMYWQSQYDNDTFVLSPLYYAFNLGTFVLVISLLKEFRERFVVVCQVALASAIVLETAALFLLPGNAYRSVGTFNNPNQLGYWALLISACVLVLRRDQRLSLLELAVLCGAGYLTMASLSKAAIGSFALLLLLGLVFQRLTRPTKVALFGLALGGMMVAFASSSVDDELLAQGVIGKVVHRFESVSEHSDDSIGGRGYDRIWRYPEHLVFGAGEGAAWRFSHSRINPRKSQKELHSTLGTVLFSYGIVGFGLFLGFLVLVFRRAPLAHALYSLPMWAYGMTHQGLRSTMLWVFFGLVFGMAHYVGSKPADDARRRAPVLDLRSPSIEPKLVGVSRRR